MCLLILMGGGGGNPDMFIGLPCVCNDKTKGNKFMLKIRMFSDHENFTEYLGFTEESIIQFIATSHGNISKQ